jgi:CubicO group peptidase (beta-lactamase class C family)
MTHLRRTILLSKYLAFLLASLAYQPMIAQTVPAEDSSQIVNKKIDEYLNSALAAFKFNGVALVAQKGEIFFHKAYGWKNFSEKTYNDTGTVFPILSITKSFTAMVVLKLNEQNKLSLSDKLDKYLPEFPNSNKITIEQLITHSSGIHNYTDDIGEEDSALVNHPVDRKIVLDLISNKPVEFKPGKSFAYNNSGFYLAGIIIEKVTGKSYEQNVRELIFDPLGMKNSGFDFNGLKENARATGYQFLNDSVQKPYTYVDSTVGYSAGSIYSTSTDMYKWTQAIAQQKILSPSSWKKALTPVASDYGIGFRIDKYFGRTYIRHSGGYPGFVSEFVYFPDEDITIILLKNSGNYGEDVWPVTMGIANITLGLPYDLWKLRKEIMLPAESLVQVAGKYTSGKININFAVRDKRLHAILPGIELLLRAENENTFYADNFNTSFQFRKNDKGIFDALIIHEHGKDTELKRK